MYFLVLYIDGMKAIQVTPVGPHQKEAHREYDRLCARMEEAPVEANYAICDMFDLADFCAKIAVPS